MSLLQTFKRGFHNWYYDTHDVETELVINNEPAIIEDLIAEADIPTLTVSQPKGRVLATKHSEYQLSSSRTGGRVVKIMPKQLKRMKQAQDKLEDD